MSELITPEENLTLVRIAANPSLYPTEVKAAALATMKQMKDQLREFEANITANLIGEMKADNATKVKFVDVHGDERELTLKSAPKKFNSKIKNFEMFLTEKGFQNLGRFEFVPLTWSECKELRKQGGEIQKVIDEIYVDGKESLEVK